MKFKTKILQTGNNTGIEVPPEIVDKLAADKKAPGSGYHAYRNSIAVLGGKYLIALSAEHRKNADVKGGEVYEISLELDTAPGIVELPKDFSKKLKAEPRADQFYQTLAPSSKENFITYRRG